MSYYIIKFFDGRIKSGFFWTDGEAEQFARDMSIGYPFTIEKHEDVDSDKITKTWTVSRARYSR